MKTCSIYFINRISIVGVMKPLLRTVISGWSRSAITVSAIISKCSKEVAFNTKKSLAFIEHVKSDCSRNYVKKRLEVPIITRCQFYFFTYETFLVKPHSSGDISPQIRVYNACAKDVKLH